MAFKMGGWSAFTKNGKYKKTKKKILSSTNIPTKEEPEGIPTEYTTGIPTEVYRKGFKKYVAETDLEHEPTGKFQQITRKGKRKLKKEGSYVSGRKYKKIKGDYESGKYAKDLYEKRTKKKSSPNKLIEQDNINVENKKSTQWQEGNKRERDLLDEIDGLNKDRQKIVNDKKIDSERKKAILKSMDDAIRAVDNQLWPYD